jgi:hypothetical protein
MIGAITLSSPANDSRTLATDRASIIVAVIGRPVCRMQLIKRHACLPSFVDRRFAFAAELARADIASLNAAGRP